MDSALGSAMAYFQASNDRDLETIESMFSEEATYSSDNTGLYYGKANIMKMIETFFDYYPELNWVVNGAEEKTDYIVELDFSFDGTDIQGASTSRRGLERLVIVDGKIRHIEVRNL